MVICFIGVGSNLGDRAFYIASAVRRVRMLVNTRIEAVSRVIETLPQGGPAQGKYLNAVIRISTGLSPYALLQELQRIESVLGRVRGVVNGPRTIDLDILTYGDACIDEPALCIPHPRMQERDFVMVPLEEVAGKEFVRIKRLFQPRKQSTGKRRPAQKPRAKKKRASKSGSLRTGKKSKRS